MKLLSLISRAAICATLLATATSCRKDLCYNHFRTASVALEWEHEWERDYGHSHSTTWDADFHGVAYNDLRPGIPEGVTMLTYTDEAQPRTTFLNNKGGDVNVGEGGSHAMLFYNNDTEYIVFSDIASLPTARATTTTRSRSTISLLKEQHPEERTINPPDVLYASYTSQAPEIGIHQSVPMPVKMQPLVYTYVIRYEFEHGANHVALARGALAGMAESVYLRTGNTSDESATILYDCDITSYGAVAHVRSFGVPGFPDEYYGRAEGAEATSNHPYTLDLEVRLTNGTIKEFTFDVTSQLARQPRGGVITVSGIRVEDRENFVNSGFNVKVDDWGEHEDIKLPTNIFTKK